MKISIIIFIFSLLISTFTVADTLNQNKGEVKEGDVLREASLYGFAGDYRKLSEFRGKPLLINVWASWCEPCRAEMGSIERLYQRYGGNQFNIIGVSTDDDTNAAFRFLMQSGVTFDNYADYKLTLETMFGANMIPLTLLINSEGRVLKKVIGFHQWDSPASIKMISALFNTHLPDTNLLDINL